VKNGKGGVWRDNTATAKPDVTISMSDEDYFDVATGKLNSQQVLLYYTTNHTQQTTHIIQSITAHLPSLFSFFSLTAMLLNNFF
jgi:hypothetical protein